MVRSFQIDILNEVRDQINHQITVGNYDGKEIRAYMDVLIILGNKIDELNASMDKEIED